MFLQKFRSALRLVFRDGLCFFEVGQAGVVRADPLLACLFLGRAAQIRLPRTVDALEDDVRLGIDKGTGLDPSRRSSARPSFDVQVEAAQVRGGTAQPGASGHSLDFGVIERGVGLVD